MVIDDALVGAFMSEVENRYIQRFSKQLNCFIVTQGGK